MYSKLSILSIVILLLFVKVSNCQFLRPYTENFTQKHYGDSCNSQNWSITQDDDGLLYYGNEKRILIYDGEQWDAIRASEYGGFVTSLLNDKSGNIYVGSYGEFGKLVSDSIGKKTYISLSDDLDMEDSFFSNVWRIFKYQEKIVFFTEEKIFFLENNTLKSIDPQTSFHLAFVVDDHLFIRQRDIGLMVWEKGKFKKVPNGDLFKKYGIFEIFSIEPKQKYLIITQELGAFYYFPQKTKNAIIPIENQFRNELINSNVFGGVLLSDGKIALNTSQKGVLIINQNAEIENILNTKTGIKDNDVKKIFEDSNGDLWLALNTGICRVNYSSQISNFNTKAGLTGDVIAISIYNNQLFAGTTNGLFEYNSTDQLFVKNKKIVKPVYQLKNIKNKLIISSELGLFELDKKNQLLKISDINKAKFSFFEKDNVLFVAGKNSVEIYQHYHSRWIKKKEITDIHLNDVTALISQKNLNDSLEFWIGTLNDGVYCIKLSMNFDFSHQHFGLEDGLNPSWIVPFKTDSGVVFGSVSGLLKYTELNEINDTLDSSYKGFFEPSNYLNLESDAVNIFKNTGNKVWLCKNGNIFSFDKIQNTYDSLSFVGIELGKINTFYIHGPNIFIGGNDGISYVNLEKKKDFTRQFAFNLRKISTKNGNNIYCGNQEHQKTLNIDYNQNTLTFNFAALYMDNGKSAEYSYYIDNYDDKWSEWSSLSKVVYKRISPGNYVFHAKTRNIYNTESSIKSFSFKILPPFYLTIWAYIFYGILFLVFLWIMLKLYTRKLQKDKMRLEKIIQERTIEIRQQKDEIETQKEEITDSIKYAKRIQNAICPSEKKAMELLHEHFILWRPRDIVSGDYWWITEKNGKVVVVAADCTGHGVPGAFMSMLGVSFLNEIVNKNEVIQANEILNQLRHNVKTTLKQKGEEGEAKDGMDLALVIIDKENMKIQYAGAYNPLFLFKQGELIEKKADRNPIGIYIKEVDSFTNHDIDVEKGDTFYIFSDGFVDQFGGENGGKFKTKQFKELLTEIHKLPMNEQKDILNNTIDKWRGKIEQVDDIIIVGVRI